MHDLLLKLILSSLILSSLTIKNDSIAHADTISSSDADYSFVLTSDWRHCQHTGDRYKEIYAFETPSFYVNICQKDNLYFYSGEAKQLGDINSIFIPAYPVDNGKGYRADNGNISYYIKTAPTSETLIVQRNGRQILTETSVEKYCQNINPLLLSELSISTDFHQKQFGNVKSSISVTEENVLNSSLPQEKLNFTSWREVSKNYLDWIFLGSRYDISQFHSCS
jgi:hypothetical protein